MTDKVSTTLEDQATAQVTLVIPCLAEFVGVVRLAILGVANRIPFTYDEVEDIRLAVGEACTNAIGRAEEYQTYLAGKGQSFTEPTSIKVISTIERNTLTVQVSDTIPVSDNAAEDGSAALDGIDYNKLGTVLMEILVDEVSFVESSAGTTVQLVKSAGQAS